MEMDISHNTRCNKIKNLSADIRTRTTNLRRYYPNPNDVVFLFTDTSAFREVDGRTVDVGKQFCRERKELLDKRELLIKELLYEGGRKGGYAGEYTNKIVLAYEVAAQQSLDLELLQRKRTWQDREKDNAEFGAPNLVMNVHLLTGRFEELYQKCQTYFETSYIDENIAEPFDTEGLSLFNGQTQCVALIHIFLIKYILHMSMENLHLINTSFLDNKDCISLIGEFVGLKKEWIITDDINWYRDQAYEVAHLIHCMNYYHPSKYDDYHKYDHTLINECFEKISMMAQDYFPGRASVIEAANRMGKKLISKIRSDRIHDKQMATTRWAEVIKNYEADHELIYKSEIDQLNLTSVSERINILAGWNAIGTNVNPNLCIAEFVVEAMKACSEYSFTDIFSGDIDTGDIDIDEESDAYHFGDLDAAVKACIAIEQKLAQCYFHMNKGGDSVMDILDQLPGGSESYVDPPPDDSEYALRELVDGVNDIRVVAKWPLDVVRLVAALFNKGLATEDNLGILFGRSGYVSCVVWALQKEKQEKIQPRITSFVTRTRLWKEGCVDNDKLSGLKIKYLNRQERSQKFVELMQQLQLFTSVGSLLQSVVPSVEQFVSKFGWKCLGDVATKQFLVEWISLTTDNDMDMEDNANPKRRRCDLDSFLTAEDACRHYFDTKSLEEAVWDHVGVPRIIILNGNMEIMQKAGWKYYKGGIRGDKSVKLGSRIAHVLPISSRVPFIICWEEEQVGKSP